MYSSLKNNAQVQKCTATRKFGALSKPRLCYTPEFKAEVVLEALRGESSQAELCRRHNLSETR